MKNAHDTNLSFHWNHTKIIPRCLHHVEPSHISHMAVSMWISQSKMSAPIERWTLEIVSCLIELYEAEDILWNDHHKKDKRNSALWRIADKTWCWKYVGLMYLSLGHSININYHWPACTPTPTNITLMSVITKVQKIGGGAHEASQSKWPYFKPLDSFLRSHYEARKTTSNLIHI